jgi:acetyl esterase/lipase
MRKRFMLAASAAASAVAVVALAPTSGAAPAGAYRGEVVTATPLGTTGVADVREILTARGFDATRARYPVTAYRLLYRTVDERGRPTTASGLLAVPADGPDRVLRAIVYEHGTMAAAEDAPSVSDHGRSPEGLMLASAGYATLAPDYLGLGVGPGQHPYLNTATEASASLDLTRAALTFARSTGRALDRRIMVTGFSQGGQAAMAYAQALQRGADPWIWLAAVAPISGPYALRREEVPAVLADQLDPTDSAYYLAYALTSWNRLYHLYDNPAEAFRSPYDRTVVPLFDGRHDERAIFPVLPRSYRDLVQPAMLARLQHPTGALARAMRDSDTSCDWTPRVPALILAAHSDQDVAFANAQRCHRLTGAPLTDLGSLDHFTSGKAGLATALSWFARLP